MAKVIRDSNGKLVHYVLNTSIEGAFSAHSQNSFHNYGHLPIVVYISVLRRLRSWKECRKMKTGIHVDERSIKVLVVFKNFLLNR